MARRRGGVSAEATRRAAYSAYGSVAAALSPPRGHPRAAAPPTWRRVASLAVGTVVVLLLLLGSPPATAGDVSGAQLDYALECQGCHRADGSGTPGSVPALAGSAGRFLRVPGGREYLARVPGVAQAPLDDARTAAVLTWVLQHFSAAELPADFTPYSGDEISRLRKTPLLDVEKERAKLLAALAAGAGR